MKNILIVEDDLDISNMLKELLNQNNYQVTAAFSGSEALLCLQMKEFDLVLLDLMLPGKTGEQVLLELRKTNLVPVIVLTAQADKDKVVELLVQGADDYVSKPFDNRELLARIDVQLRKNIQINNNKGLKFKDLTLLLDQFDVEINKKAAGFSKTEFAIVQLLMTHPNKVFTKNNLYESVWGGEFLGDDNTINVHISKIRQKLAALNPKEEYIQTVWGIGFKMQE